jgi:hypothetical protein
MGNKLDAFVVTKPLQYINVLNINNSNSNGKILLLIDVFHNASSFFEEVNNSSKYWNKCYFFPNMQEAFNWLIANKDLIESLYIDSDINNRKQFFKLRNLNIVVYEEGVGTYRKRQYKPTKKLLGNLYLLCLSIMGYKNRRGGNKYTKKIIVYFPEFYKSYISERKKAIESFNIPFNDHIKSSRVLEIFDFDINSSDYLNKTVALYLPGWDINKEGVNILNQLNCERRIIKQHPHPNPKTELNLLDFDLVVSPDIPAEILILKLIEVAKKIFIISEFSSSTIYFYSNPKIKIINLPMLASEKHNDTKSYLEAYENLSAYINEKNKK